MDLGTIYNKLHDGYYTTANEFGEDVRLVWNNAKKFNKPHSEAYHMAVKMSNLFEKSFPQALQLDCAIPITETPSVREILDELKESMKTVEEQLRELRTNGLDWSMEPSYCKFYKTSNQCIEMRSKVPVIPVTDEEKSKLHAQINQLDSEGFHGVLTIIEEEMPHFLHEEAEEIILDLNSLDDFTLCRLIHYIKRYIPNYKETKK
eukprot:TRINITY_DN7891_c0_g1_i5.p2 TRINITY_DN7891_c0_g1~~TRINITY_DN7891_c0_g1_i5.p2  ORF type:complete len:205 (-),score=40.45 TRINITY_DN7891_c0_g1_i5:43-657(-)